jgi:hypothetical protein
MTAIDLTYRDLHPDAGEPKYEPSRMAVELVELIWDVLTNYDLMAIALDHMRPGVARELERNLWEAIDNWNEGN